MKDDFFLTLQTPGKESLVVKSRWMESHSSSMLFRGLNIERLR